MQAQEAIKELSYDNTAYGGKCTKEVRETAINALEKQNQKKPVYIGGDGIRYTDLYRCPNCGQGFTGTGIADYCYHCGQKLDWSE
ncbi:MAG: hypothetical protein J6B94_08505 [Lachnospiraceae bacterium]|nr:hypothetical protein [Lachnospiraceae bacterium]